MIINGRQVATEILASSKTKAELLPRPPLVVALVGQETPSTLSYLKIKTARAVDAGCRFEVRPLGSSYEDADAVIVQLPLPEGVDTATTLDALPVEKDADVLSRAARASFENGEAGALLPPVAAAVKAVFEQGGVEVAGRKAVVVGAGFLVGAPVATWLRAQGAEVSMLTIESSQEQLAGALRTADLIVSGAGSPHLITPDLIEEGVVLIDAGTSESGGVIVGDADPACAEKCMIFTPVPGGIGPIAVACLFENAVTLAERASCP